MRCAIDTSFMPVPPPSIICGYLECLCMGQSFYCIYVCIRDAYQVDNVQKLGMFSITFVLKMNLNSCFWNKINNPNHIIQKMADWVKTPARVRSRGLPINPLIHLYFCADTQIQYWYVVQSIFRVHTYTHMHVSQYSEHWRYNQTSMLFHFTSSFVLEDERIMYVYMYARTYIYMLTYMHINKREIQMNTWMCVFANIAFMHVANLSCF